MIEGVGLLMVIMLLGTLLTWIEQFPVALLIAGVLMLSVVGMMRIVGWLFEVPHRRRMRALRARLIAREGGCFPDEIDRVCEGNASEAEDCRRVWIALANEHELPAEFIRCEDRLNEELKAAWGNFDLDLTELAWIDFNLTSECFKTVNNWGDLVGAFRKLETTTGVVGTSMKTRKGREFLVVD